MNKPEYLDPHRDQTFTELPASAWQCGPSVAAFNQRGFALIALLSLAALFAAFLIASALDLTSAGISNERAQRSMSALRQAKAALIAYASERASWADL